MVAGCDVQVSKGDMEPAKTEEMLRGGDEFDDSARGSVMAINRTSTIENRSPGPNGTVPTNPGHVHGGVDVV